MKKISFIIPVFNCREYITICVKNILEAEFDDYEILLIDDGSADGSAEICEELMEKNESVNCIHQLNKGVSYARNAGLRIADGEYIIFLDADDSFEAQKLKKLLYLLDTDDSIDMAVFGMSFDFYYHGKCYRRDDILDTPMTGKQSSARWIQKIPELYAANSLSSVCNKVMRRNIIKENQLELREDMFLYEDLEFSLRSIACCDYVYFSQDIIYHYRQSEDQGNAGRRLKKMEHLPVLIGQIEQALNELIEKKHIQKQQKRIKSILLMLYLVLAREKISVSNVREIRKICDDFAEWFSTGEWQLQKKSQLFTEQLCKKKVMSLIFHRTYTAIRHKIAILAKNTRLYQRLKGQHSYGY